VRELLTNTRGENPLVTYEPVDFEKRKKDLFKTFGKSTIVLEETAEYTSN
jgi:hypothetical protein